MIRDRALKEEFARRLYRRRIDKGWNQSELARRAQAVAPDGVRIGRDLVNKYEKGDRVPEGPRLEALAKALGCRAPDLLPTDALPLALQPSDVALPDFQMDADMESDTIFVRINQRLPSAIAFEIQRLVFDGRKQLDERMA